MYNTIDTQTIKTETLFYIKGEYYWLNTIGMKQPKRYIVEYKFKPIGHTDNENDTARIIENHKKSVIKQKQKAIELENELKLKCMQEGRDWKKQNKDLNKLNYTAYTNRWNYFMQGYKENA